MHSMQRKGSKTEPLVDNMGGNGTMAYSSVHIEKKPASDGEMEEVHDVDTEEVERERKRRRDKDPLLYCTFVTKYPRTAFGLAVSGLLFLTALNIILQVSGVNMFPFVLDYLPLDLKGEDVVLKEWAWSLRNQKDNLRVERYAINATRPTWLRGQIADAFDLYYTNNEGNVLTQDFMKRMQKIESQLFETPEYQNKFCLVESKYSKSCAQPVSILRYFDGTHSNIDPIFYDPNFTNIASVLYKANNHPLLQEGLQYFLTRKTVIKPDSVFCDATRASYTLGWPVRKNASEEDQLFEISSFYDNVFKPKYRSLTKAYAGPLQVYYYSLILLGHDGSRIAIQDIFLSIGSLCFIFGYMWFQTESLFVTFFAILSILLNFFSANLFYRIILDYRYLGHLHIISIFIILGIGADNIFVFFNTWKATGLHEYKSLAHRMSDCYRRTALTMFFTSLTTMVAFMSNGMSPLLVISSFGIFTGVLVAVNYISVVTFFPTVVSMYHHFLENNNKEREWLCKCPRRKKTGDRSNLLTMFFRGIYFKFITHKIVRWIIVVIFLAVVGVFSWAVSLIKVDTKQVELFQKDTNFGRVLQLKEDYFKPSSDDDYVSIYIVWGLQRRDLSSCHFSDYKCTGNTVWDTNFDLNPPPVQIALKDFCKKMKTGLTQDQVKKLMIANDTFTGQLQVQCFMDNLETYMLDEEKFLSEINETQLDLQLPYTETNMLSLMQTYDPIFYNVSSLQRSFYRFFEVAVSFWLSNGYTFVASEDYILYNDLVGEARDFPYTRTINYAKPHKKCTTGCYGTKLRYAAIRVNLTLEVNGLAYPRGLAVMNDWDRFLESESLVNNGIFGIVLGICLAFPILVIATGNIIVGTFATLVIGFITICIIGITPVYGWRLGIIVSVNFCVVVGLSVDYVVHLAEGYHMSPRKDRLGRVHDMLAALGSSVLSGAVTTMGAALFMLFGNIVFFHAFGVFLFSVILFSLAFSLGFFSTCMAIFGPEGNVGALGPVIKFIIRGIKKIFGAGSSSENKCDACDGKGYKDDKPTLPEEDSKANGKSPPDGAIKPSVHVVDDRNFEMSEMPSSHAPVTTHL